MLPAEFKRKRQVLGFTQESLAEALGLRANTVSRYETGNLEIPKTVELAVLHLETQINRSNGFNLISATASSKSPEEIMSEWFNFEGRECPADYGVIFFKGWESFTREEKIAALTDAKRVLDRSLGNSSDSRGD